jgi:hypothetical protein
VHLTFIKAFGILLALTILVLVFVTLACVAAWVNRPPLVVKPPGLAALEASEDRRFQQFLEDIQPERLAVSLQTEPPVDPGAPRPAETRLYNNLLDNLLSGLHYYYRLSEDTQPSVFVTSWDADTGARVLGNARLLALEYNTSYLLTLTLYRSLHKKTVFDSDLEFVRNRVAAIFEEDWHTVLEWPLGVYFDLVALWEITGEEQYSQWAERYAVGRGPEDVNTPLFKARTLAWQYQYDSPRIASPVYFYYAALLADWGRRNDPTYMDQARTLFAGLRNLLHDPRYNLMWKQASVQPGGTRNLIQTFDTLENLTAIRAILEYAKATGDPTAISLARTMSNSLWGTDSPLLLRAPEPFPPSTYFGLYTAYDLGREAKRLDESELTIIQILLYEDAVLLNEQTRGELRADVDFLASWLEDLGPMYRQEINGYYNTYGENWGTPDQRLVSAKASIWMARALVWDEWYRYRTAQALAASPAELGETQPPGP